MGIQQVRACHQIPLNFYGLLSYISGRVAAPDSNEAVVKTPRRIPFFDGYVLRDLQLSEEMGVAVTENGDIMQWGKGYLSNCRAPIVTLSGKDIVKVGLSQDRIIALSSSGNVYSMPFSKEEQELFAKPKEHGSIPFSSWDSPISYRSLTPKLGFWETVVDIAVGLEHTVMLTSAGRVFTAASATYIFPLKGQLGIPEISWDTKPKPYDTPQEVTSLGECKITQIAAGDYHSIAAGKNGKIFTWGDNTKGQLGFNYKEDSIMKPTLLPQRAFYKDEAVKVTLKAIYAGGLNSFFTMDAETPDPIADDKTIKSHDVFSCGYGVHGTTGSGIWAHAHGPPQKLKTISGLTEYSEKQSKLVPIGTSYITVGGTHAAVVMSNLANIQENSWKRTDVEFGNDIMFFGGNEFYQLGNGKRVNLNTPTYVPPLEPARGSTSRSTEDRFQVVPAKKVAILDQRSKKRSVKIEQRVIAGRGLTGCYARTCS
ncbi:hypothetical protein DRE_05441 [Drechslerella stenobrocha 248]|uniref:Uncharacterized protein n=1 Tax=Drechslerella stenobrocha 248 TaxID=1043628 RepID=W7I076_9PEZI|nr:hypothetical protein DRE_05441 [Drechslerella stenobrocha 248]